MEVGDALAKAVTAAGALPVFATAAPYLVAAGVAIPLATKAANLLARPQAFLGEHAELNFNRAGVELAQPGALVLYGGRDARAFEGFKLGAGFELRDADGAPYQGELPYAVISLDGTERQELDGWSATAASAALVERFFTSGELATKHSRSSVRAWCSITTSRISARPLMRSGRARPRRTRRRKKQKKEQFKAYLKNIKTKELRETVDEADHA